MNHVTLLIILAVIVCIFILIKYTFSMKAKRFKESLKKQFGQTPCRDNDFESICSYWQQKLSHEDTSHHIDELTWNDLDMDKIFERINSCQSSVGEEYLYALLHEPVLKTDILSSREKLMAVFDADADFRADAQVILSKIGRQNYNGLSSFCYDIQSKKLNYPYLFNILALLPLVFTALLILKSPIGLAGLIVSFITNSVTYYFISKRIVRQLSAMRYFSAVLWGAQKINKVCSHIDNPIIHDLASSYDVFKNLGSKLSGMAQQKLTDIDFLIEYIHIIFLTNIRSYNKILEAIEKNTDSFSLLYKSIGEVDAVISVLSFRKSLPFYIQPDFSSQKTLEMSAVYHPLLASPVPNSINLFQNSLVSGSNASGKSTFIKAVAVNGILAQTINTCTAKKYQTQPALMITSMAVRDNISAGESYFITEIKSLKRILQAIQNTYCICIIDEILKGTNTIERIAASASVLNYLNQLDCLCIVATHDIELTRILADKYHNYHFSEQITEDGIQFDYKIKEGPSHTKNAIKLLSYLGFDDSIINDAENLVQLFEETKSWPSASKDGNGNGENEVF
jgi:rRNA-processing protein FCF1